MPFLLSAFAAAASCWARANRMEGSTSPGDVDSSTALPNIVGCLQGRCVAEEVGIHPERVPCPVWIARTLSWWLNRASSGPMAAAMRGGAGGLLYAMLWQQTKNIAGAKGGFR